METFIEELSSKKVLSKDDIILLKQYIAKKYAKYTKKQQSDVLSRAIYQVIDKSTSGLDKHYINLVKNVILKNTILKNGDPVLFSDILNLCISIGDSSDDLKHTLLNWINLHIENKISKTDLEIYCSKNSSVSTIVKVNTNLDFIIKTNYAVNNEIAITSISPKSKNKLSLLLLGFLSIILIVFAFTTCLTIHSTILEKHNQISNRASRAAAIKNKTPKTNILVYFKYKEIDKSKLIIFLNSHNSLLAEEPYFSTIIAVSKQYDLNPLILFAITGQEENFVSKQDSNSKKLQTIHTMYITVGKIITQILKMPVRLQA